MPNSSPSFQSAGAAIDSPSALQILCVPAFQDNYFWLIHNGQQACAVDPGAAAPILAALEQHQLTLCAILITHHHADHVGGITDLLAFAPVPVYGPALEAITGVSHPLHDNAQVSIPELGLQLQVLAVPGHTLGHIAYYAPQQHALFCGDTLFAGGCGRLFEGSPAQMLASLTTLAALPEHTAVYCAHEYTLSNLKFAREVDGDNLALSERIVAEQAKREAGLPTVPSCIGLEKLSNPFLRCEQTGIIAHLVRTGHLTNGDDPVQTFAALREWKNNFR